MFEVNKTAQNITKILQTNGFQAYLVGGCIRDLLLGLPVDEWDITTSAKPIEVSRLFKKVVPTGIDYGTVTVLENDEQFEVTTFRSDEKYIDGRHPSNVAFTDDIHKDLSRRDFTINALAYDPQSRKLIDDFNGQKDLKKKIIRAIGKAVDRFNEDGLRPVRACRFAAKLGFKIYFWTLWGIKRTLKVAQKVAPERIHDELIKMLAADRPSIGLELMRRSGLLKLFLPELEQGRGVSQPSNYHRHDVYWHNLYSCDAAPKTNLVVRLAALLHDLGKPTCKVGETFYNHENVGAKTAGALLKRLKFSNEHIDQVTNLIEQHMFNYKSDWSDSAVRRLLRRIGGTENVADLFALRRADVAAMQPTADCSYLPELQKRIDKIVAEENALHVADLKVDGHDVMQTLNIPPGPKVGAVLEALLEKVLDDPGLNEKEILLELIKKHAV